MFGWPTSDVSAVVLTRNEPTTEAAIASLHRQSLKPCDIIVVRDVVPFHRALNVGAAQVKSRFFVQVDADMILNANCISRLRRGAMPGVGIVVGHLRDALIGRAVGIKLFRTACFHHSRFGDSISPDTDFVHAIATQGWRTRYIGRQRRKGGDVWRTFGEHKPDYTASYTYRKYLLEGQRYFYRHDIDGIRRHFSRLETSRHPAKQVAQIALAQGIFAQSLKDKLGLQPSDDEAARFASLEHFLKAEDRALQQHSAVNGLGLESDAPPPELFSFYIRMGNVLFRSGDVDSFVTLIDLLNDTRHNDGAWIAKVALCKGLCASDIHPDGIRADYELVSRFLLMERSRGGALVKLRRQLHRQLGGLSRRRISRMFGSTDT